MPNATAQTDTTVHKDLKSLPTAFVELRELSYGEKLTRRAMASKALMKTSGGRGRKSNVDMEMDLVNTQATFFDFAHSIVDHNLEDADGRKLNMTNPVDIQKLNPRVGEEIGILIDELNNFESDGDDGEGNSSTGSSEA